MANTLKLKQSAVSAKIPTTAQLQLGELAVNTYDGRLFTKKNVSGTESIIEFVSNSGTWGISITGNAATATTLQTARNINGTSFNGSANITTASWGTARTLTIGSTGKSVDGSAAVSWSLAEIGALPLTGGTLNGILYVGGTSVSGNEGGELHLTKAPSSTLAGNIVFDNYLQQLRIFENGSPWRGVTLDLTGCSSQSVLLHSTNYSTYALPLAGGTLTGDITAPRLISNVAQGTAPLGVTSTTVCTNLNADMVDGLHEATIVHGGGTNSASRGAPATWSGTDVSQYKSGFWDVYAASWAPNSTDWWWGITLAHSSNSSSYLFGGQLAIRNGAGQDIYVRHLSGGPTPGAGAWHRIWTSGSDGSGSGLDADLLDGYHVGTSGGTIPLLNAANTWSNTQTVSSTSSQVLLHSGVSPSRTAMLFNNGTALYILLSDESISPSSTYNSLRPFYVNLTTGAVTMAQGVTITNGLTLTGGASITGGLSAYSATNDYTQATVKFGRVNGAHIAIHGYSNGNYLTHVATDANPDPFRIALKTETLSWEHVFAMDGYIVPSQGIRWDTAGVAPPATSTRSGGTKLVLYPSLGASTVDHAVGIDTNTLWYSIPQQSSRCFKWYAGITPIAALHGDGNHFVYDPGPTTKNTSGTLTDAQIRTCIIQSTPTAGITLTLPTSTNMNDTLWDGGTGMDWSVINLATDGTKTVTLAGNTNHTIVGNAVVAINSSARFRTIKAIYEQNGLPVFTTYRIS